VNNHQDTGESSSKRIRTFAIVSITLVLAWVTSLVITASPKETVTEDERFCTEITDYLYETIDILEDGGTTYTVADVTSALLDRGTTLVTAYDVENSGLEWYNMLQHAGNQLLQIRVALIDGGDVNGPAQRFASAVEAVEAYCR
jgi:hypothetical protein